jgi:DNA polymerase-4
MTAPGLCRDCGAAVGPAAGRCPACGSPRLLRHAELDALAIAHLDCDAFYATIEKRDDPSLADQPVIVGGGRRGVVAACCYVARTYGIHSAQPMFKALRLCPHATVIRPNMAKYAAAGREVRRLLLDTTPLVEPISIDEAFLDLSGTERLHHGSPARTLALLARRIEREIGITVSIGLSYNKFLAKVASDLDKPRGFAVIGRAEAMGFLAPKPVTLIWGVGKALMKRLERDGISRIETLQIMDEKTLVGRYGVIGRRLYNFSRGIDGRHVDPGGVAKSVSAETTFDEDLSDAAALRGRLWPLCEKVAARLKAKEIAGRVVTLKLKTADFHIRARSATLAAPTQLAEVLYRIGADLLAAEAQGEAFRLIGIGVSTLAEAREADPPSLLDPGAARRARVERAIDAVRARLGDDAIAKGRGLLGDRQRPKPPAKA